MGKVIAWTAAEDDALRSFWKTPGTIAEHQWRIPNRGLDAIAHRAKRLGLGPRVLWTRAEDKALREIWANGGSIKSHAHQFPLHSIAAIITRAYTLGLGRRAKRSRGGETPSWKAIEAKLKIADLPSTILAEKTGLDVTTVKKHLGAKMKMNGVHISSWRRSSKGGCPTPVYRLGAGISQPRPKALTDIEKYKRHCEKHDLRRVTEDGSVVRINPFATAAGLVSLATVTVGASYRHSMTLANEESEAA